MNKVKYRLILEIENNTIMNTLEDLVQICRRHHFNIVQLETDELTNFSVVSTEPYGG